ncbi:unnamed protein product [Lupinus luteus]|uniref:Zinc ion binding protein n=1 Tax=Lupinus luteus TaxID=3873 RepID=A0AAV1X868_LUPLU
MNVGDLNKIWQIKALKRKPAEDEATKMLDKIAKQVQPIMRKHKWRVKLLSEFCPTNPRLLGLNVGAGIHVKLRLRRPNRDLDFYPFDQVLDTMLHELCHNAHGPHNANFYKLWDELRKECEELMSKGIVGTGDGFDLKGRRLVQAAAMAAERRLQDDVWCASQSCEPSDYEDVNYESAENLVHKGGNMGKSRLTNNSIPPSELISRKRCHVMDSSLLANSSSTPKFVDLTMGSPKIVDLTGSQGRSFGIESISHSHSGSQAGPSSANISGSSRSLSGDERSLHSEEPAMWECLNCTLLNKAPAPVCELCGTEEPKDVGSKYKMWCCKFCTLENSVKLEKCSACDQWRYSHGQPLSTGVPNLDT